MSDAMRELLHASIQWRSVRALVEAFKSGSGEDEPFPRTMLDALTDANKRLWNASLAAEKDDGR